MFTCPSTQFFLTDYYTGGDLDPDIFSKIGSSTIYTQGTTVDQLGVYKIRVLGNITSAYFGTVLQSGY